METRGDGEGRAALEGTIEVRHFECDIVPELGRVTV